MKIVVVILVVIALGGASFGTYAVIQQSSVQSSAENSIEGEYASKSEVLALKGEINLLKEKNGRRVEDLETIVGQQAQKIEELNRQLASLHKKAPAKLAGGNPDGTPSTPVDLKGIDRETLKSLLGELSEEKRRDDREQQYERMQEQNSAYRSRSIDGVAKKYSWDDTKKEQVTQLLEKERQKIEEIRQEARNPELSQETRRETLGTIRTVMEETQEALKAMLTEEEIKDMQRSRLPRRDRRSPLGGRSRGSR